MWKKMFKIVLTKEAAKYYQKSDKRTKRLLNQCFEDLKASPLNGPNIKRLHGELVGLYRYRVTCLRVIYSVKEENVIVVIVAIGSRGDIYKWKQFKGVPRMALSEYRVAILRPTTQSAQGHAWVWVPDLVPGINVPAAHHTDSLGGKHRWGEEHWGSSSSASRLLRRYMKDWVLPRHRVAGVLCRKS